MTRSRKRTFSLTSLDQLDLRHVIAARVNYRGRPALRLLEDGSESMDEHSVAVLTDSAFRNGTLRTSIAGAPLPNASPDMRGFVGIAFHVHRNASAFECFYLRPTNGRAEEQLRRNHATQYVSHPDYPWYRLRQENPGVYESYADLVTGAWTDIKIVVQGVRAWLYVGDSRQPTLIVNDLKLGATKGQIALWIGGGTQAYFGAIRVENA